jgi:hypothetical protein
MAALAVAVVDRAITIGRTPAPDSRALAAVGIALGLATVALVAFEV